MNSYQLSRIFWDWAFENPDKVKPSHPAIYFFAIEHCNRLGWKDKFGFPSEMVMDATGISKYQTYINHFNDLVDWGFFVLIEKSKNQYSSNIISINSAMPKNGKAQGKALDKAIIKHGVKQLQSIGQSKDSIDKQYSKPINNTENRENYLAQNSEFTDSDLSLYHVHESIVKYTAEDLNFLQESAAILKTEPNNFKAFCLERLAEMKLTGYSSKYQLGTIRNILIQDFKLKMEEKKRGITSKYDQVIESNRIVHQMIDEKYGTGKD